METCVQLSSFWKKSKNTNSCKSAGPGRARTRPHRPAPLSPRSHALCLLSPPSLSLSHPGPPSHLTAAPPAPSGRAQDEGSLGCGPVPRWWGTSMASGDEEAPPPVHWGPGSPGQGPGGRPRPKLRRWAWQTGRRDSEVAEDLTLLVPVHLRGPLVDASGPRLLLSLGRSRAQVEATLLKGVTLPGAAILGTGRVGR